MEVEAKSVVFMDFIDHTASDICGEDIVHGILEFNFDKMLGRWAKDKGA